MKQLQNLKFCRVKNGDKRPFEPEWQKKPYTYEQIQQYRDEENYGVLCGYEGLLIIDADTPELTEGVLQDLPDTFRVQTGSGGVHHYYFCPELKKKIVLTKDNVHYGEIQSWGSQCVGPGSLHPNGNTYDAINDSEIATLTKEQIIEFAKKYTNQIEFNSEREEVKEEWIKKFIEEIVPKWKEGDRQELALSTAGYLRKEKKLGAKSVQGIISEICDRTEDKEKQMRLRAVIETFKKDEGDVKGASGLKEKGIIPKSLKYKVIQLLIDRKRREASEVIVKEILEQETIYTTRDDKNSEIWIYREGIYKPQGKSYIKEFSRRVLEQNYTTNILNEIILKIESDTLIEQEEFFKEGDPYLLPVKNGILNLKNKELMEFSPDYRFFTKLPVEYNPEAKCPNINNFFKDVLKDEGDIKVMMEFIGFALVKDYFMEKSFMFVGDGRNGKGKSLTIIKNLLGLENISSISLSQMTPDSFSVSELHGKLINIAGDISSTDLKDTGLFKSLTGRDPVSLKRKFMKDLKIVNYATMVFACNELPRVYDNSKGFWSRWVLLEFPYEFVSQKEYDKLTEKEKKNKKIRDPDIIEKIVTPKELSGLLNEAIRGLQRIRKNKDFSYSVGTAEIKDFWIRKSNSFLAFCLDHLEEDAESHITKKMIRRNFSKYCKKHRLKGAGDKDIKATLQDMFGVVEEYRKDDSTLKQEWVWTGIKWRNLQ